MKSLTFLALAVLILSTLTACNTVKGVGQDVAVGGRAVERAATTR
jgi:entericidin B